MAMKFYSDKTKRFYDTAEECQKAEFEMKEAENREKIRKERELAHEKEEKERLAAERKARAAEVEEARKVMVDAQKKYRDVLDAFIKDYHTYHFSSTSIEDFPTLFDMFSHFL